MGLEPNEAMLMVILAASMVGMHSHSSVSHARLPAVIERLFLHKAEVFQRVNDARSREFSMYYIRVLLPFVLVDPHLEIISTSIQLLLKPIAQY